jgi:hypothetical protein
VFLQRRDRGPALDGVARNSQQAGTLDFLISHQAIASAIQMQLKAGG